MATIRNKFVFRNLKAAGLLLLILLLPGLKSFAGPGKSNFTGKWSLNESMSTTAQGGFGPAKMITISQEDNNLVIDRMMKNRDGEDMTFTLKYTLDGKECDNSNQWRNSVSVVSWSEDGKSMTINTTSKSERDGQTFESTSVETWKLSEGGKSLTINQVFNSSRGERKSTLVYDKQ